MSYRGPGSRRVSVALLVSIIILISSAILIYAANDTSQPDRKQPKWVRNLPAKSCPGSSYTNCHSSSPVVADITGDGKLEIVVATNNGHVIAMRHDGSILWQTDVAPAFGMASGKQEIASSPAVADIDQDGKMEIVVGAGTTNSSVCTKGGVIVLDHKGRTQPGWPFISQDHGVPPAGCPDSIFSTPALGDLDRDGDLEIVFGGFDKRVIALNHNGRLVAGFPPDSNHYSRFGWNVLQGRLADTIWSSPALSDINGDGFLDIVIGSDEGNFDNRWQPVVGSWSCPYRNNVTQGFCGGSIYAFDRFGRKLQGFPQYKYETIQSTPATMDIDADGRSEMFIGTGSWYHLTSPDHPTLGFRLFGMDGNGNDLPGWQGGKVTGGFVAASPSIGDITGDGKPNVVVGAADKRLYAWHMNGQPVAGFPMTPRTQFNQVFSGYNVGVNFILADYSGDGKMEIFMRLGWEIVVVNGKGRQLTAPNVNDSRPVYGTKGTIMNNPAIGDLNGDGHLELVVQNSQLTVWDLPNSSEKAHWPMFKKNAARTSMLEPSVSAAPQEFQLLAAQDRGKKYRMQMIINGDLGKFDWHVSSDQPGMVKFPRTSGVVQTKRKVAVNITIPAGLPLGMNHLGDINVTFSQGAGFSQTETIPIKVRVLRQLHQSYLPIAR